MHLTDRNIDTFTFNHITTIIKMAVLLHTYLVLFEI